MVDHFWKGQEEVTECPGLWGLMSREEQHQPQSVCHVPFQTSPKDMRGDSSHFPRNLAPCPEPLVLLFEFLPKYLKNLDS